MGQTSKQGLGFTETTNTAATKPKTMFVKASVTNDVATTSQRVSTTAAAKTVNTHFFGKNSITSLFNGKKRFVPICHFCNKPGHIRPKCFEYRNIFKISRHENYHSKFAAKSRKTPKHKIDLKKNVVKKIWIKKSDLICYVAHTSLKVVSTNFWYFDSGCSKHMTGDKKFLKNYKTIDVGHVTFGDGVKARVLGKGTLDFEGLPKLKMCCMLKD